MPDLQFSANTISATKEITHSGRRYLVSPVVALREGILNGVYVSALEFGKHVQSWSGRPVPLGHPKNEGGYISANSPDIWAKDVPGHFWNVEVDGDKLKGEIWIDLEKAQAIGERALGIVNRLRANQPVEVSTGYFADNDAVSGVWNGQPYIGIARHIRPDHLALLPDEIGACSWADGCGTPRVNSQEESMSVDEQGLFQRFLGWLKNESPQNLEPAAANHLVATQETVVPEANISMEGSSMNKTELIGALTANAKCKFSQEKLATWEEADLTALQQSIAANDSEEAPADTPAEAPATVPVAQDSELMSRIAALEDVIKGLTANQSEERSGLTQAIVANCRGAWNEAELGKMEIAKLRQVHGSYLPRDFSANAGSGALWARSTDPEEEELVMHWPVFEKKEG